MKASSFWFGKIVFLMALFVLTAQAATGPEVAQLLNTRYRSTPLDCPGRHAAYFCSGVLVSGFASGLPIKFWEHTDSAIALGAHSFSYLRSDQGIRSLTQNSGMVFSDPFTAISQGKTVEVLCAYPLVTSIQGNYGCGTGGSQEDPASCAALDVSDASGWLAHFQQQGQQPSLQCSLSSLIPAQFRASLLAHEQLGASWVTQPNQVQVRNWDAQAPAQVPVQALFYDTTQTGGLRLAQHNQRDYHAVTGQWLPILRLDLEGGEGVFGFNLQDQLYVGYEVATRLNARYSDTTYICPDGSAAYNCNGVLIRTTDASTDFHAWNPSPGSIERNGISFSYMRADMRFRVLGWSKNQGLIMKELAAPTAYPLTLRCSFPFDGDTYDRTDSCNFNTLSPVVSRPCDEQGITTVQEWLSFFNALTHKYMGCSFKGDAAQFAVSVQARVQISADYQDTFNEVIIANWGEDIPTRIPLEAFFYIHDSPALPRAQFFQHDYFIETGKFLPIVRVDLAPTTDAPSFSYDPQDQAEPGAPGP